MPGTNDAMLSLLLGAFLLGAPSPTTAQQGGAETPRYEGRAFVFRADLSLGRAAGWIDPETPDADVLDRIRAGLRTRVRSAGRFVESQVLQEEGGRFAVVFVGRQDARIEAFLQDALGRRGRLAVRVVPGDEELASAGCDPAAERQRLDAWRGDHADRPLESFRAVPREEGGPHPLLDWLESDDGGEPVALVRGAALRVRPALTESRNFVQAEGGRWQLRLELNAEGLEQLSAFGARHPARQLVLALDGRVILTLPVGTQPENPLFGGSSCTIEEARSYAFALSAEIPVPLVFEEFSRRPLLNTTEKGE
jgi:hypothetical protein